MGAGAQDVAELLAQAGTPGPLRARAVARLISMVESGRKHRRAVAGALAGRAQRAHVVGLTGPPGVGKSTSTAALIGALRAAGRQVGVLAVDPSSPLTGGALLGDRIRMGEHGTDPGVLIRSMASRGHLGGLAAAAPLAIRVLDAAGCDVVLVETVGVGQSEIEVATLVDTTVVLMAPGMGDGIQAAKAGLLEVADVLVVNKADRPEARATRRELRSMLELGERGTSSWPTPVLLQSALTGEGIDEVIDQIAAHRDHLLHSGDGLRRRRIRAEREIEALVLDGVRERLRRAEAVPTEQVLADVATGRISADDVAEGLLARL